MTYATYGPQESNATNIINENNRSLILGTDTSPVADMRPGALALSLLSDLSCALAHDSLPPIHMTKKNFELVSQHYSP